MTSVKDESLLHSFISQSSSACTPQVVHICPRVLQHVHSETYRSLHIATCPILGARSKINRVATKQGFQAFNTLQMLDLPGIIEGAADGKGRGRQVISTARTSNLILIVLDVLKPITHKLLIEKELEGFGIRLNKTPPKLTFKRKDKGGISFVSHCATGRLTRDEVMAVRILPFSYSHIIGGSDALPKYILARSTYNIFF